jgi:hypothetical protein
MTPTNDGVTKRGLRTRWWLGAVFLVLASSAFAKTPDGMPPSEETVCSSLSGAAFGLCNAYCEAQDCDVHPRPSCPVLRKNFEKITGSSIFPCDRRCGDGTIERGEECDPPGSECPDGRPCNQDCTCPEPACGDGMVDPDEQCDPPGSICTTGVTCRADCTCVSGPVGCCECAGTVPICSDDVPESQCPTADQSCQFFLGGAIICNDDAKCALTSCCLCPDEPCRTVDSVDLCPSNCILERGPSVCDAMGNCQSLPFP